MTAASKPFSTGSTFLMFVVEKKGTSGFMKKVVDKNLVSTFTAYDRKIFRHRLYDVSMYMCVRIPPSHPQIKTNSVNDAT